MSIASEFHKNLGGKIRILLKIKLSTKIKHGKSRAKNPTKKSERY